MLTLAHVKGLSIDYPYDIRSAYLVSVIERERALKLREFELLASIAAHAGSSSSLETLDRAYHGLFPWAEKASADEDQEGLQNLLDMWENTKDEQRSKE